MVRYKLINEASDSGDSVPLRFRQVYSGCRSTSVGGSIYFAAQRRGNWNARLILSFDLGDEVFKVTSVQNGLANARFKSRTTVFSGLLSLICHDDFDRANKFCSASMSRFI